MDDIDDLTRGSKQCVCELLRTYFVRQKVTRSRFLMRSCGVRDVLAGTVGDQFLVENDFACAGSDTHDPVGKQQRHQSSFNFSTAFCPDPRVVIFALSVCTWSSLFVCAA